jgi:hypothetical protein
MLTFVGTMVLSFEWRTVWHTVAGRPPDLADIDALEPSGDIPPAEFEAQYDARAGGLIQQVRSPTMPVRFTQEVAEHD